MSRINLSRVKKLETAGKRLWDARLLSDEELLAHCCDYEPEKLGAVLAAYREGGLEAAGDELLTVSLGDDPAKLALALEADRRGDLETVAHMLEERHARAI